MLRTWVGLGLGAACGLTIGIGVVVGFGGWHRIDSEQAAVLGLLMAGVGAAAGSTVGGVGDVLRCLREATGRNRVRGHEADYREPDRPNG